MPTMTASTMTLMPELTTLPSTRSARKAVRFQSAKGTRTNPASVVSLNSNMVINICTASTKKAAMTISQEISRTEISTKFRSEEHTSELKSLMRISYSDFCVTKKKKQNKHKKN